MACISLAALPRACGAEGVLAGLEKLYAISFIDLAVPTGATNGDVYTTSTGGLISAIGLDSGKKFVEIGLLKSSAGLSETLTKDSTKGISYLTQSFTMVLADLTSDNKTFVEGVMNQPIAIIVKSRTGKFYAAGLNGQLELSALESGTGTAEGDTIGYTLTFSGISTKLIPQVDSTIISTLIS